ncbi:MAG: UPF0149 family protein [Dokdonella sp.]
MNTHIAPLDDAELDELGNFLDEHVVPHDGMSLEMLGGFLTAIVSGPAPVEASQWMPLVWHADGEAFEWPKGADSARMQDLVQRYLNQVLGELRSLGDDYSPLLTEYEEDGETLIFAQEWALGYLQGMELNAEKWLPLLEDSAFDEAFGVIEELAEGPDDPTPEAAVRGQDERDDLIGIAIGFVIDADAYWQHHRGETV